jgi:glycosyltransferase involved in cell wall biosynthesis
VSVLGVIPNDRLDDYEAKGIGSWLARYYNPRALFDRVYCLSPVEERRGMRHGMLVMPTRSRQLPRRVRRLGVEVLRAYGGGWTTEFMLRSRDSGVPMVASVHTTDPASLSRRIVEVDFVICASHVVADLVRAQGVEEGRIRILPNRVDRDRFRPDPSDRAAEALRSRYPWRHRILHVGRRSPEKNLDTVIAGVARLGPEYGLLAIGPGDYRQYRAQADALGVANRCCFLGAVANETLPSYYRWCTCLCGPSRWEGFGLVFIEAMACGAAVVTSDIRPMTEYIQDGVNGILVKAFEDPEAVAAAIAKACDGPVRGVLSDAARRSTSQFAVEVVDSMEAGLYEEILASWQGTRRAVTPSWHARLRGMLPW